MNEIEIYCTGISLDEENSVWGAILISGKHKRELFGIENGNAQRMALLAVIKALEEIKIERANIKIYVPVKLFVTCIQENWLTVWQKNDWLTSDRTKVKNCDLWEKLIPFLAKHNCQFFRPKDALSVAKFEEIKRIAKKNSHKIKVTHFGENPSEKKEKSVPLFRIEIAVNLIPEENISLEKIKSLLNWIKKEFTPNTLDVSFPEQEKKKEEPKKEKSEDDIQKYSEKLSKNPSSWSALFGRGCALLKKGERERAKADFVRFLELSEISNQEQILKDRENIFLWFPELKA